MVETRGEFSGVFSREAVVIMIYCLVVIPLCSRGADEINNDTSGRGPACFWGSRFEKIVT